MSRKKVTVVGAGHVGASTAQRLIEKELADVVLVDIIEGLPQGKALDLMETAPIEGYDVEIIGTNDYSQIRGSDVVVVTAGVPRKPGMSRSDLLGTNARIVGQISKEIRKHCPDAIVVVVTNPLDIMTHWAREVTGFEHQRVFGMAGVLDSARFRAFIAMELGVSMRQVDAMVLGSHGDSMVPLPRFTTVSGVTLTELLPRERIDALVQRTRDGGAEIVKLLKEGSAYYAPSAAVVAMVRSILRDEGALLPCCAYADGVYGLDGVYIGVPCILGAGGVRRIVEITLDASELAALRASAAKVREDLEILESLAVK